MCPTGHIRRMMKNLAAHGWMFRVGTPETGSQPAVIYFAVGKNSLQEAMAAALDHPDIEPGDAVAWADRLTSTEIWSFRLGPDEVRTYGKRPLKPQELGSR
jgi:hypothetical protein